MLNKSQLKNKIKIIGLGAMDSPYNVEDFKKTHRIEFPLFPDEDRTIHKLVGEPNTPHFIGVDLRANGRIFYTHNGPIPSADEFIRTIIEKSGIEQ